MRFPWSRREAPAPTPRVAIRPWAEPVAIPRGDVVDMLAAAGRETAAGAVAKQHRQEMRFDGVRRDDISAVYRPHADALRSHPEQAIWMGVVHDHASITAVFVDDARSAVVATMALPRAGALSRLGGAGWTMARFVDPSADLRALREMGVDPWPEVRSFLSAFGGLELDRCGLGTLFGSPWHPGRRAWFEDLAGTSLAVIGDESHHMTYLAGRDGRFFGEFDHLYVLGHTPLEFLDLVTGPPTGVFVTVEEDGLRCEIERSRVIAPIEERIEQAGCDGLRVTDQGITGVAVEDPDRRSPAVTRLAADLRRMVRE